MAGPAWRYLFYGLRSNSYIAQLPLENVDFEVYLGGFGPGSFTAELHLGDPKIRALNWRAATELNEVVCYSECDGVIVGGHMIWDSDYKLSTQVLQLKGTELPSYYAHRVLASAYSFTNVDQLWIVRRLMEDAIAEVGGDLSVELAIPAGSGILRTRSWKVDDGGTYAQKLDELAKIINGFDYVMTYYRDGAGVIHRVFTVGFPRLGRTQDTSPLRFSYPGNIIDFSWPRNGSTRITRAVEFGANGLKATATDMGAINARVPLLESAVRHQQLIDPVALQGLANGRLAIHSRPALVPAVQVKRDAIPPFNLLQLGDDAPASITEPAYFPGPWDSPDGLDHRLNAMFRLVGLKVTPGKNTKVDLVLSQPAELGDDVIDGGGNIVPSPPPDKIPGGTGGDSGPPGPMDPPRPPPPPLPPPPAGTPGYRDVVLADSPVGYWPLTEPAGAAIFADLTSNNLNGNLDNVALIGHPDQFVAVFGAQGLLVEPGDTSLRFTTPGTPAGAYVALAASHVKDINGQSIECWVAVDGDLATFLWLHMSQVNDSCAMAEIGDAKATDYTHFWEENGPDLFSQVLPATPDGKPHHLVWTRTSDKALDGHATGLYTLYVDGVRVGQRATHNFLLPSDAMLHIGYGGTVVTTQPRGRIGHVALYSHELGFPAVLKHYNAGRTPASSSGAASGPYHDAVLADYPVGYWPLADRAGSILFADLSGNFLTGNFDQVGGVNGGALGAANVLPAQPGNTSMAFTPGVTYGAFVPGATLYITDDQGQSVECWVKLDAALPANYLWLHMSDVDDSCAGALDYTHFWEQNAVDSFTGLPTLVDGHPHHLVWTRTSEKSTDPDHHAIGYYTLYVDGVQIGQRGTHNFLLPSDGTLHMGGRHSTVTSPTGRIAHVALYDHALSAAAVLRHYNIGKTVP